MKQKNKTYFIPIVTAKDVTGYEEKELRRVFIDNENYYSTKEGALSFLKPTNFNPDWLEKEINLYNAKVNKGNSFDEIVSEILKSMLKLKISYGGNPSEQGDLSNKDTMCVGFVSIVERFLSDTGLKYRFVLISGNELVKGSAGHIWIEVFNPEEDKWQKIEATKLSKETLELEKERCGKGSDTCIYNNIIKNDRTGIKLTDANAIYTKDSKEVYRTTTNVTFEYIDGVKVKGSKAYSIITHGYDGGKIKEL